MSQLLENKIAAVQRRRAIISAGTGVAALVGAAVLLLAAGMIIDWFFDLPKWARGLLLAIDAAAIGYLLIVHLVMPIVLGPDIEDVALLLEGHIPEFRTRLIASIQLSQPQAVPAGISKSLVAAMVRQTEEMARPMDFTRVVKAEPLLRTTTLSAFIVLFALSGLLYSGDASTDLLKRAFLSDVPVPRKTRVTCTSGDRIVAIGDPVNLEAEATGVIPASGQVRLEYASGRKQSFIIDPAPGKPRTFLRPIENVQESFRYRIRLNDGQSEWHEVRALPRPSVVSIDLEQVYPAYTRKPAEKRSAGDLLLLAGSKLQFQIKASKPIKQAFAHLVGLEKDVPLAIDSSRSNLAGSFQVPARGLTGFSVKLVDDYGLTSRNETVYPVDVVPDKDPTIRVIWPDRKDELATQQARLLIAFEAADDFGVARVLLRYRIDKQISPDSISTGEEKSIELDLSDQKPEDLRRFRRRHEFDLSALKVVEGNIIEYWLEVEDGNNVTGPGRSSSDRFRARIVSEIEKRADLMNRLNDQLGTIDYVTQDEEKLNQTLGQLIFEKK